MIETLKVVVFGVIAGVVFIFLGLPYMSWAATDSDGYDSELSLEVTAICPGYLKDATFEHTQSFDERVKPGYFEYLGGYWDFGGGEAIPDYPYLSVTVQAEYDSDSRTVWRMAYTYGETLDWSGEYPTYHGELLLIQLQIFHDKGVSSSVGWKEIVP